MRYALSFCLVLLPLTAIAGTLDAPVIGGSAAPEGEWPDAAALYSSGEQGCSGTLIAPTVVLTAGHCVSDSFGPPPDTVMVGGIDEQTRAGGETIDVTNAYEYPGSQSSIYAGLLVLA